MRVSRIAPARQLVLFTGPDDDAAGRWEELPEQVRGQVLTLLAVMIARDVLAPAPDREAAP